MMNQTDLIITAIIRSYRTAVLLSVLCFVSVITPPVVAQTWRDQVTIADSLSREGEFRAAADSLQRALAVAESLPGTLDTALGRVYYKIAYNAQKSGDLERARRAYAQALEIYSDKLGPTDLKVGKILNSLGFVCQLQSNYQAAESYYLRCLEIMDATYAADDPALLLYLENPASLYIATSELSKAEPLVIRQVALAETAYGPEDHNVATALGLLGDLQRRQGKLTDAESHLRRSLNICRKTLDDDNPALSTSLTNLANLLSEAGEYDKAEGLYREALSVWRRSSDADTLVGIYNLGLNYMRKGNYFDAEPLLKKSLDLTREVHGSDHAALAYDLESMAILYTELGLRREAEKMYLEAIRVTEKALGQSNSQVALRLNNLGLYYTRLGRAAEAEPLLNRSLEIYRKTMPSGHPATANAMESLADLYASTWRYEEATRLYEEALVTFRSIGNRSHSKTPSMMISLGEVYHRLGQPDTVQALLSAAIGLLRDVGDTARPEMARCLELISDHMAALGNNNGAIEAAAQACQIRHRNLMDFSSLLSERDALAYSSHLRRSVDRYLAHLVASDPDGVTIDKAAGIVLAAKGIVSDAMASRWRSLTATTDSTTTSLITAYNSLKRRISDLHVSGGRSVEPDELLEILDSLATEVNEIEAALARHSDRPSGRDGHELVTAARVAEALPGDAVLVEYVRFFEHDPVSGQRTAHYIAFVFSKGSGPVLVELDEGRKIERLINRYRGHFFAVSSSGHMPSPIDQAVYNEIAQGLYGLVWQPIAHLVSDQKLVLIAPDGDLNLVSFAGLIDPEQRYIVENLTLHYLSSGRDLVQLESIGGMGHGLWALGDPAYDASVAERLAPADSVAGRPISRDGEESSSYVLRSGCGSLDDFVLEPLPFTRTEVESVVGAWRSTESEPATIRLGNLASEERLRSEAPGKRVIHLATHGYFLNGLRAFEQGSLLSAGVIPTEENPLLLSGLFLAGANLHGQGADIAGAEDGILTAYEVSGMDLQGVDLVVLSACETGLGDVKEGEGVFGLRRSFQLAGARRVISSLWSVPDQFTAAIISQVYAGSSEALPERLRQVQLEQIESLRRDELPTHPFLWAGFTLLGDWR